MAINITVEKTGYLLINLGTPAAPDTKAVRSYLNEFLMDPYVIDSPWLLRRLLVSAFILPFRPKRSAAAYAEIWQPQGSPLLTHSRDLATALAAVMAAPVALGMRYGQPGIAAGLTQLADQGVTHVVVAPLYPQYADSTVTTSIDEVERLRGDLTVSYLPPFYARPEFIEPSAALIKPHLAATAGAHLLLSYHGLPERHLQRTDPTGSHCLASPDCCERASSAHATCYRHQVMATSKAIAASLQLAQDQYTVSFQSRLGRLPWLQPYTDQVLQELPQSGVKQLVVACPAFVADNLETLEEIALQGRETFLAAGGERFAVVPCLNAEPAWVQGLADLLADHTSGARILTSS